MKKAFYFKIMENNIASIEILNATDLLDAISTFQNQKSTSLKLKSVILITSALNELLLNQEIYNYDKPFIGSFEEMGMLLLSHVKSNFNFDEAHNSKRLTSITYKRHLAALTLKKAGQYSDTFTYTYSIVSEENPTIELRYLQKKRATFVTCYVRISKTFLEQIKFFINSNSKREEFLRTQLAGGKGEYKRHSAYFDYEFKHNA